MPKDWKKIAEEYGGTYTPPPSSNMENTTQENAIPIKKDWKKIAEEYGGTYTPASGNYAQQEEPKSLLNKFVTTPFRGIAPIVAPRMSNIADRVSKDIFAGSGYLVHGLLNAPAQLAREAADLGIVSHEAAEHVPYGQPKEYDFSKLAGIENPTLVDTIIQGATQYAPYAIGGEAAGLTRAAGAISKGPWASMLTKSLGEKGAGRIIGSSLSSLRNIAGEGAVGGIFGATQAPDVEEGAISGAIGGAAIPGAIGLAKSIPAIGKGIAGYMGKKLEDALPNFDADRVSNSINSYIGEGKHVSETRRALASSVKSSYEKVRTPLMKAYVEVTKGIDKSEKIFEEHEGLDFDPNTHILKKVNKIIGNHEYVDNFKKLMSKYTGENKLLDAGNLEFHNQYLKDPSFPSAHKLQSQLGQDSYKIMSNNNSSLYDRNKAHDMLLLRNKLKQDMHSFLKSKHGSDGRAQLYDHVSDEWAKNIGPYETSNTLMDVALGKIKNPSAKQIRGIFGYPEGAKSGTNEKIPYSTGTYKILEDIKNHTNIDPEKAIIHSEMHDLKGKNLINKFDKLSQESAVNEYIPKDLPELTNTLRNILQIQEHSLVKYPKSFIKSLKNSELVGKYLPQKNVISKKTDGIKRGIYREAVGTTLANYLNPDYNR